MSLLWEAIRDGWGDVKAAVKGCFTQGKAIFFG